MLDVMLDLQLAVENLYTDPRDPSKRPEEEKRLSELEWMQVAQLHALLGPLRNIVQFFEGDQYPTFSAIYPLLVSLKSMYENDGTKFDVRLRGQSITAKMEVRLMNPMAKTFCETLVTELVCCSL